MTSGVKPACPACPAEQKVARRPNYRRGCGSTAWPTGHYGLPGAGEATHTHPHNSEGTVKKIHSRTKKRHSERIDVRITMACSPEATAPKVRSLPRRGVAAAAECLGCNFARSEARRRRRDREGKRSKPRHTSGVAGVQPSPSSLARLPPAVRAIPRGAWRRPGRATWRVILPVLRRCRSFAPKSEKLTDGPTRSGRGRTAAADKPERGTAWRCALRAPGRNPNRPRCRAIHTYQPIWILTRRGGARRVEHRHARLTLSQENRHMAAYFRESSQ